MFDTTKYIAILCAVMIAAFTTTGICQAKTRVYLLGGQSNMAGHGDADDLTGSLAGYAAPRSDIQIWRSYADEGGVIGSTNGWIPLAPEYGDFYPLRNDPTWGSRDPSFGPEVSFGAAIKQAYPNDDIYLIKHAWGATSLAGAWDPDGYVNWNPTNSVGVHHQDSFGVQYYHFRTTVAAALADLDANSVDYEIAGMLWMQGESDAINAGRDAAYQANLTAFIADMRSHYDQDLPFIIGRINPVWGGENSLTRAAQQYVAENTDGVEWFDTDGMSRHGNNTNVHYDTLGQIQLGEAFAANIPEPATLSLLALGGLALIRRKRH